MAIPVGSTRGQDISVLDTTSLDLKLLNDILSGIVRIDPASPMTITITEAGLSVADTSMGGWITQVKTSDQTFQSTVSADITELTGFAPVANAAYEFDAKLLVSSSQSNLGVRPSFQFPTGVTPGHITRTADAAYNTEVFQYGGPSSQSANNNAPTANVPFIAETRAIISVTGVVGVGNIRPQFAGDSAANTVTVHKHSMIRWRKIA